MNSGSAKRPSRVMQAMLILNRMVEIIVIMGTSMTLMMKDPW